MRLKILLPLFFLSFFNVSVFAIEKGPDTTRQVHIDDVTVISTRTRISRNTLPLTISVIERPAIENSSESSLLPVLSQHVPGLFVTQKGITGFGVSEGAAGAVNIRGIGGGNRVLILSDGQPQWAGIFGHALPDMYVASDAERVEVIRGPGSLIYGSNAMGGVVNVITRRPQTDGTTTGGRLLYGSFNTQKYMINNACRAGKFSSFISVNHDRTDGHRDNSWFRITNGFVNLGYDINDRLKLTGSLNLATFKGQNPGQTEAPMVDNTIDIFRGTSSLAFENRYEKMDGAVRLFYSWGNHVINDGYRMNATPMDYLFKLDDHNRGAMAYQTLRLFRGSRITFGIDYKNWGGRAWNDFFDLRPDVELIDRTIDETAGYLITGQDFGRIFSLNAGLRYENNSAFGSVWIPQAGFSIRPTATTTLKGSFSKGFRSPNLRELYMFPPHNPDLQPENMFNYDLSAGEVFWGGKLSAELTLFFIDGKNMIETVSVPGRIPPVQNRNTGNFINKGIEFDVRCNPSVKINFSGNYSYLHTRNPMLHAPKHKLCAMATWTPGSFSLNADFQWISGIYTSVSPVALETFGLLNLRAARRFSTGAHTLDLFIKGENLTAAQYSILYGYPMPRAIVLAGINFGF